jgi:hypothetical protein
MSGVPRPRRTASLAKSLDQQLNLYTLAAKANCRLAYAAAASAVGTSALSLAPLAEAKIIYTPTHVQIPPGLGYAFIDFDYLPKGADADFKLVRYSGCPSSQKCASVLWAVPYSQRTNGVAVRAGYAESYAAALRPGSQMGPHKRVVQDGAALMARHWNHDTNLWEGRWANGGEGLKNGYLGLKFVLNGRVHYGWARVSLTVKNNRFNTATLTGYAFETIPNKSIIIGKTQGPDVIVRPATLGDLAAGTNARSAWRTRGAVPDAETDVAPDGHWPVWPPRHSRLPPFPQRTRKEWGTPFCV